MSFLSFLQDTAAELSATSSAALQFDSFCCHHCCWMLKQYHNYTGTDLTGTYRPTQNYKRMPPSGGCTALNFYSHVTEMSCDCMAFARQVAALPAFSANFFCKPCCCTPATENQVSSLLKYKAHLRRTTRARVGG